jgi:hypothetical protein
MTPQAELLASAIAAAEKALEPFARAWSRYRGATTAEPLCQVWVEDFKRASEALRQLREAQK